MFDKFKDCKKSIIEYGEKLYTKGLSPSTSGNISLRVKQGALITCSGSCLGDLTLRDISLIDFEGNLVEGAPKPSSERFLHLKIYQLRPDIDAIIHCHAPKVSSFAAANIALDKPLLAESVFYFGKIPLAAYATPSSQELVDNSAKFFSDGYDAVLMANHGLVVGAKSLKEAYFKTELAENCAEVYLNTMILDRQICLTKKQVEDVLKLKQ